MGDVTISHPRRVHVGRLAAMSGYFEDGYQGAGAIAAHAPPSRTAPAPTLDRRRRRGYVSMGAAPMPRFVTPGNPGVFQTPPPGVSHPPGRPPRPKTPGAVLAVPGKLLNPQVFVQPSKTPSGKGPRVYGPSTMSPTQPIGTLGPKPATVPTTAPYPGGSYASGGGGGGGGSLDMMAPLPEDEEIATVTAEPGQPVTSKKKIAIVVGLGIAAALTAHHFLKKRH